MATITQLEYLLAVDRNRHFGKAAKDCHVSQPSLSVQIQKLEEEYDVIIFDRSKKPILLTERGKAIVEQAKLILREHHRLDEIARQSELELQGDFLLGIIPTLAPYLIPLFLKRFSQLYPKVKLKVIEHKTEDILRLLKDDRLDAGLLVTPLYDDSIIERSLFYEPFYAFVSSEHQFYKRKFIKDEDLDGSDIWLLNEGHCFRDQVIKVCSLSGRKNVVENVVFEGGSLETLKNLVKQIGGYTLLPHLAADQLNSSERKSHLKKFTRPAPTREVSLVHSRSFLKEGIITALENTIIDSLPRELSSLKKADFSVIDI